MITGYTTLTHHSGYDAYANFSADGKPLDRAEEYFNADGFEARLVTYGRDGVRITERTYDPVTGLSIGFSAKDNGQLVYTIKYAYDGDDALIRSDTFSPEGKPYAYVVYDHGREAKKDYKYTDGTHEELTYAYDRRHWLTGTRMTVNGGLVCTFTIDRRPDGSVIRSLATGPDGTLWAEYPDMQVAEVLPDGHPANAPTAGILHKTGRWF